MSEDAAGGQPIGQQQNPKIPAYVRKQATQPQPLVAGFTDTQQVGGAIIAAAIGAALIIVLIVTLTVSNVNAASNSAALNAANAAATLTAAQTQTANALLPTATPGPTWTPTPTFTPAPTDTPTPPPTATPYPAPTDTPVSSAPPPQGCYPLTNSGNCYEPGEYCRSSDQGTTGIAGNGERIICTYNNGLRWEPY